MSTFPLCCKKHLWKSFTLSANISPLPLWAYARGGFLFVVFELFGISDRLPSFARECSVRAICFNGTVSPFVA